MYRRFGRHGMMGGGWPTYRIDTYLPSGLLAHAFAESRLQMSLLGRVSPPLGSGCTCRRSALWHGCCTSRSQAHGVPRTQESNSVKAAWQKLLAWAEFMPTVTERKRLCFLRVRHAAARLSIGLDPITLLDL